MLFVFFIVGGGGIDPSLADLMLPLLDHHEEGKWGLSLWLVTSVFPFFSSVFHFYSSFLNITSLVSPPPPHFHPHFTL